MARRELEAWFAVWPGETRDEMANPIAISCTLKGCLTCYAIEQVVALACVWKQRSEAEVGARVALEALFPWLAIRCPAVKVAQPCKITVYRPLVELCTEAVIHALQLQVAAIARRILKPRVVSCGDRST